jgi:hypothetical protein
MCGLVKIEPSYRKDGGCDAEKLIALVEERRPIFVFFMKEQNNRGIQDKSWAGISTKIVVCDVYLLFLFSRLQ